MKLITLNTWGGRLHEPLLQFFARESGSIDIFCLQEVFSTETALEFSSGAKMNLYQEIKKKLPGYKSYYAVKSQGYDYDGYIGDEVYFGNVVFLKDGISVLAYDELFEVILNDKHDWKKKAIAKAQLFVIEVGQRRAVICNFHGIWLNGTNKRDTPERIEQSNYLKEKLDVFHYPRILCGDFNLLPGSESIGILEKGMRNLITEYGITSTRSSLYKGEVKYADYVLADRNIHDKNLVAMPEEVSDHLPLLFEFDL